MESSTDSHTFTLSFRQKKKHVSARFIICKFSMLCILRGRLNWAITNVSLKHFSSSQKREWYLCWGKPFLEKWSFYLDIACFLGECGDVNACRCGLWQYFVHVQLGNLFCFRGGQNSCQDCWKSAELMVSFLLSWRQSEKNMVQKRCNSVPVWQRSQKLFGQCPNTKAAFQKRGFPTTFFS